MKITFTADDSTVFDTEADCLGWERFCQLKQQAINTLADPEDDTSWNEEFQSFLWGISGDAGGYGGELQGIWRDRRHLFHLVELMKQAEAS